jgi:hypothetical protein
MKKTDQGKRDMSNQGINRVLIYKKLIPCQWGIYKISKILIPGRVGYWSGISWKWNRQVGYMIPGPGPW